jgi:hypothetical protein
MASIDLTSPSPSRPAPQPTRERASGTAHERLRRWLREPLLHFLALGALLFVLDAAWLEKADDPNTIVLDRTTDGEMQQLFQSARGRLPNDAELQALRRSWLDNEVLYRQGLALQVDRGDKAIRERVIFKSLNILEAGIQDPVADEATLRTWFEGRRAKYDEPARYDFQEAVLSGDTSDAAVRAFADALNAGNPGDAKAGLRVFKGRPHENLLETYGADFAQALEASPPGVWRAHRTREGLRVMRLDATTPARAADFTALRGVVLHDWVDATKAQARTDAVRALGKRYKVLVESAP